MRAVVLINEKAGTVIERGAEALAADVRAAFEDAGHTVDVECCSPDRMDAAIEDAASQPGIEAVIAGGGVARCRPPRRRWRDARSRSAACRSAR